MITHPCWDLSLSMLLKASLVVLVASHMSLWNLSMKNIWTTSNMMVGEKVCECRVTRIIYIANLWKRPKSWWRHQMETFSALLALCAGNSPVSSEFPSQRPVTRSFDVFFDLHPNKRLSKQSWGWWFETRSHPLWRQCNVIEQKGWCFADDILKCTVWCCDNAVNFNAVTIDTP